MSDVFWTGFFALMVIAVPALINLWTASRLAAKTAAGEAKVLGKIEETHKANTEALATANNTNEKILKIAEKQAELSQTLKAEPMKVELTGKPGIVEPLIVTQRAPRKRVRK